MKILFTGNEVYINGRQADLASTSANITTANNQCPYVSNFEMRLILPRVMMINKNNEKLLRCMTMGEIFLAESTFEENIESISTYHKDPYLFTHLAVKANSFVERSMFFSKKGICPKAGFPFLADAKIEGKFWPASQCSESLDVQVTSDFLHYNDNKIVVIPVENANFLPPKDFPSDLNVEGFNYQNIINGYYIDWDISRWEMK